MKMAENLRSEFLPQVDHSINQPHAELIRGVGDVEAIV
jgi:hypothetical protein